MASGKAQEQDVHLRSGSRHDTSLFAKWYGVHGLGRLSEGRRGADSSMIGHVYDSVVVPKAISAS